MLELGPRELVTLGTVLAGLAATWGVLKTTIRGMVTDLDEYKQELNDIATRLDKAEAKMAVAISSIDIVSSDTEEAVRERWCSRGTSTFTRKEC
jgi:uncharacterized protein (DUF3084 family)